ELDRALRAADHAAGTKGSLELRFAALCARIAPEPAAAIETITARLRVPNACRVLALRVARAFDAIRAALALAPADLAGLVRRLDLLRRPERLEDVLGAVRAGLAADREIDAGRVDAGGPDTEDDFPQAGWLRRVAAAAASIDAGAIAATATDPARIPEQVHQA